MARTTKGRVSFRSLADKQLQNSQFLGPLKRYLGHHFLWQFNRHTVAGGAAIGLFFGILIPFFQIFFACFGAIVLRVNLPVAAACTLITNPLTFPPIYYLAYRIGDSMVSRFAMSAKQAIESEAVSIAGVTENVSRLTAWFQGLLGGIQDVGLPLAIGLLVLSVSVSLTAYLVIKAVWSLRVRRQWWIRKAHRGRTSS